MHASYHANAKTFYSTHEGNRNRLEGLDEVESSRATACAVNSESSRSDQEDLQQRLDLTAAAHARTSEDVLRMRNCYNFNVISDDGLGGSIRDTATGDEYPPLSDTLAEATCDVQLSNSSLEDGVFDCEQLPVCEIGCGILSNDQGVDSSNLLTYSFKAACTAEYWVHAVVLRIAFCAVLYLFINVGRVLAVMGLNRLMWQWLNTGLFAFLGSSDAEGSTTVDEEELGRKIQAALRRLQVVGGVLVTIALLLQLVWIVPMASLLPELAAANTPYRAGGALGN